MEISGTKVVLALAGVATLWFLFGKKKPAVAGEKQEEGGGGGGGASMPNIGNPPLYVASLLPVGVVPRGRSYYGGAYGARTPMTPPSRANYAPINRPMITSIPTPAPTPAPTPTAPLMGSPFGAPTPTGGATPAGSTMGGMTTGFVGEGIDELLGEFI